MTLKTVEELTEVKTLLDEEKRVHDERDKFLSPQTSFKCKGVTLEQIVDEEEENEHHGKHSK